MFSSIYQVSVVKTLAQPQTEALSPVFLQLWQWQLYCFLIQVSIHICVVASLFINYYFVFIVTLFHSLGTTTLHYLGPIDELLKMNEQSFSPNDPATGG